MSNFGRVRSLSRTVKRNNNILPIRGKIIALTLDKYGYLCIVLSNNIVKKYFVHRLVAEAFIPNPNNFPCINHKNEIKTDNNAENLEWCTHKYNNNYGSHKANISHSRGKWIIQLALNGEFIARYRSAEAAHLATGISVYKIRKIANHKMRNIDDFVWEWE